MPPATGGAEPAAKSGMSPGAGPVLHSAPIAVFTAEEATSSRYQSGTVVKDGPRFFPVNF